MTPQHDAVVVITFGFVLLMLYQFQIYCLQVISIMQSTFSLLLVQSKQTADYQQCSRRYSWGYDGSPTLRGRDSKVREDPEKGFDQQIPKDKLK